MLAVTFLFASVSAGCPPTRHVVDPPDSGDAGGLGDSRFRDCGIAQTALDQGDFVGAVTLLREQSVLEPEFGAAPRADICLSRALLGEGDADAALALAAPLAEDRTLADDERRQACLVAVWASLRTDDSRGARRLAGICEGERPLGVADVLRPDDSDAAHVVLATLRYEGGDYGTAFAHLEALLAADDVTREWSIRTALSWAQQAPAAAIVELGPTRDPLTAAAILVAERESALAASDPSALERLLPLVQEALNALDSRAAQAYLGDLPAVGVDEARAPMFGVVLPTAGPHRAEARAVLAGLLLAQRAFQPGYEPFSQLLIRDTAEDPAEVRTAVAELVDAGVIALIAPTIPEIAEWVEAEAERLAVPVLSLAPTAEVNRSWRFGFYADPAAEADALLEFATIRGLGRIAIAMPSDASPHAEAVVAALGERGPAQGIGVDEPLYYYADDLQSELEEMADRLSRRDFEALLIADTGANATTLAAYLAVHNVWSGDPFDATGGRRQVQYFGTSSWEDTSFLNDGPDYLAGGIFPAWLLGSDAAERFAADFSFVYGRPPGLPASFAYDALTLLRAQTLDYGASSRAALRQNLLVPTELTGATGPLRFGAGQRRDVQPQLMRVTSAPSSASP